MAFTPEKNNRTDINSGDRPTRAIPKYEYEVLNSSASPDDLRLRLALPITGEEYTLFDREYLYEVRRLARKGLTMSKSELSEFREMVGARMLNDEFSESERATTFEVFAHSHEPTTSNIAAGARLVEESSKRVRGLPDLELPKLVVPDIEGEWRAVLDDDPTKKYGELGRVVVVKQFRDQGLTTEIIHHLIDGENGVREVAMEKGIDYLLLTAQPRLLRHLEQTSLALHDPLPIKLRMAGKRVARQSPGYWKNTEHPPQLVVAEFPPKEA
jgi:hypothetical protein